MSTNDKRNPIEEMLKDAIGGEEMTGEPPTETEGFDSLVTAEEYEAIMQLSKAMKHYIDVHNEQALNLIDKFDETNEYQRVQLMLLSETVDDAQSAIAKMVGIHTCDKKFIDTLADDMGFTVKGLERNLAVSKLISHITG